MTDRNKQVISFPPVPLLLSLPPLSVSLSSVCRRNTLLYLHPNDPSSGPRGWALCITQRSIRARAWRLLCPIINPDQLTFSLSLPSFSHTCPSSAPHLLISPTCLPQHARAHATHIRLLCKPIPPHSVETHAHFVKCTHTISHVHTHAQNWCHSLQEPSGEVKDE